MTEWLIRAGRVTVARAADSTFVVQSGIFTGSWFGQSRAGGSPGSLGRVGGSPDLFFALTLTNHNSSGPNVGFGQVLQPPESDVF